MWLQQDGAPAHASNVSINYLRRQFPGRLISRRVDFLWPPRSPDLAIDFFLWGYLKQKIWGVPRNQQPTTCGQLGAAIIRESQNVPREPFTALVDRCQRCVNVGGHAFADE